MNKSKQGVWIVDEPPGSLPRIMIEVSGKPTLAVTDRVFNGFARLIVDAVNAYEEPQQSATEENYTDRLEVIATELNEYAYGRDANGERYPEWDEVAMAFYALERALKRMRQKGGT
jgi:hypothetical protein